jgi:hypothetical protein
MTAPVPSVEKIVRTALLDAWMSGCTCNVEIVVEADPEYPRLFMAHCHHDDSCPLLRRRNAKNN